MNSARFDDLIHSPLRLRICAFLEPLNTVDFQSLKKALDVSDSVLSKHLKLLIEAGYVKQEKITIDGRQRTWVGLDGKGRTAFNRHVEELRIIANL